MAAKKKTKVVVKKKSSARAKASAKRTAKKKAVAKKAGAKKAVAKKAVAKKAVAKKAVAKKATPKKAASLKRTVTAAPARPAPARPRPRPTVAPSGRRAQPSPAASMRRPGLAENFRPPASHAEGPSGLPRPEILATEDVEDNRRRFRRVDKELKVRLFAGDEGVGFLEASLESADMSLSGMFLKSTFFVPEETPVRIEFDAPWGQVASAAGIIARVQRDGPNTGFGIRFLGLNRQSLTDLVCIFVGDQIQEFVDAFCREGDKTEKEAATLWEGILAWEIERLRKNLEDSSLIDM